MAAWFTGYYSANPKKIARYLVTQSDRQYENNPVLFFLKFDVFRIVLKAACGSSSPLLY